MARLVIIVAVGLLLIGGVSNLWHPGALEEYLATRVTWRAAIVIPLARGIAVIEIGTGLALCLRFPGAAAMAAAVFLAYVVVHTYELVKVTPLGCPCVAGSGSALLPPRLVHATLGATCAVLCVGLLSIWLRWANEPAKEIANVQVR